MEYSNLFFSGYTAVCEKALHAHEHEKPPRPHGSRSIPLPLPHGKASSSTKSARRRSLPPLPHPPSGTPPAVLPSPSNSRAPSVHHTAELVSASTGAPSVTLSVCDTDEDADAFLEILYERFSPLSVESFRQQLSDTCQPDSPRTLDTLHPYTPHSPRTPRSAKRQSLPAYIIPAHPPPPPPKIQTALSAGRKGKTRADLSPIAESPTADRPVDWPHDPIQDWRKAIDDIFGDDALPDTSPIRTPTSGRRRNLTIH